MSNSIHPTTLMGYNIHYGDLPNIAVSEKTLINTINPYSFCIAEQDSAFKACLQGVGLLFASVWV